MKIDVAIQSYKKPESLIYTLLSLKKVSGEYLDTVYIQDDLSGNQVINVYRSPYFQKYMSPIRIEVIENEKKGLLSKTMFTHAMKKQTGKFWKTEYNSDNIRYQYAINHSDKNYLLIVHDDILFYKDIVSVYLRDIQDKKFAIVGDLGQCWICSNAKSGCTPEKILSGVRPDKIWPCDKRKMNKLPILRRKRRDCRINEWCCMIDLEVARKIGEQYHIYFGNYQKGGDIGAYWFDKIIELGYDFNDPVVAERDAYYLHCWQGFSGHSVWVDQGVGKSQYDHNMIKLKLKNDFGFEYDKIIIN